MTPPAGPSKVIPGPWRPSGGEPPRETLEVRADRLVQDWSSARERAQGYLEALGFDGATRTELARRAVEAAVARPAWNTGDAVSETMGALRDILYGPQSAQMDGAEQAFLLWRTEAARGEPPGSPLPVEEATTRRRAPTRRAWIRSTPPLDRGVVVAHRLERRGLRRRIHRHGHAPPRGEPSRAERHFPWIPFARRRRILLALLVVAPSLVAMSFMAGVLPHRGRTALELAIALFFGGLFAWISIGFWTAVLGWLLLLRGRDRFAIRATDPNAPIAPEARTAIVMPICNEPVERVFAGLKVIYASLERAGLLEHFDFFILSDTSNPSAWVEEEAAWVEWCRHEVRLRAHLLPAPPRAHRAEERQHRRLLPALGPALPLHGRARRRQRDERRDARASWSG